jgi:hypothetical protein
MFLKECKTDKEKRRLDAPDEDLDERSKHLGLKALKKGYQPRPYTRKRKQRRHPDGLHIFQLQNKKGLDFYRHETRQRKATLEKRSNEVDLGQTQNMLTPHQATP